LYNGDFVVPLYDHYGAILYGQFNFDTNVVNNTYLLLDWQKSVAIIEKYRVINNWYMNNDVTMSLITIYLYVLIGHEVNKCVSFDLSLT